jgi:hypothetical protein
MFLEFVFFIYSILGDIIIILGWYDLKIHYLPNYSKESASNIWISLGVAHGIMPDITILGSIAHEGLQW